MGEVGSLERRQLDTCKGWDGRGACGGGLGGE